VLTASAVAAADKVDPLAQARLLYNQRKFQEAVSAAEQGRVTPTRADSADLIGARAYLEIFRESGASDDLTNARERLRRLDPQRFDSRERAEFIVGLGEWLRASLATDHGVALREDLDRLMLRAIVPERARMLSQPAESLRLEWERFKEQWKKG
jgi:hypothetical protein